MKNINIKIIPTFTKCVIAASSAIIANTNVASAYLGGFESGDGYQPFLNMVQNYNAGQYGSNNSGPGGTQVSITPNTGLWQAVQGGFGSGSSISYATGHQYYNRASVNAGSSSNPLQALVLTTGHQGWTGPALEYMYDLDTRDLDGAALASVNNNVLTLSFWWCAQLDSNVGDGYFGDAITFYDSNGTAGFTFGLTERSSGDKVTYWNGSGMTESSIVGPAGGYDRWDLTFNFATDKVSASYLDFSSNTIYNLVSNADLSADMLNLSSINFRTSPGVSNAKYMSVDDFNFTVAPEASTGIMAALASCCLLIRKRK